MRCARCDRIYARELLARDRDGRLVFGWCPECLVLEDCQIADGPLAPLVLSTRPRLRIRVRKALRFLRGARAKRALTSRRLALLGIVGLMAVWGLILCFVGGVKLAQPGARNSGNAFLAAAGLVAIICLGFWLGLIARTRSRPMILRVVQVAAAVIAVGTLGLGALGHATRIDGLIFLTAITTFGACWLSLRVRTRPSTGKTKTPARP